MLNTLINGYQPYVMYLSSAPSHLKSGIIKIPSLGIIHAKTLHQNSSFDSLQPDLPSID
jgi:hypothetical protein